MSTLLVDIGNSRIKWALARGGRVIGAARAVAHEQLDLLFTEWARLPHRPTEVRLVNVQPGAVGAQLSDWLQANWQQAPDIVATPAVGGGITVAYPQPARLGADRWLAMVGARAAGYLPACIVDCGSAITVDVINGDGTHRGGMILAGLGAQQAGLSAVAPALPAVELAPGAPFLASNTPDALASGHLHATALGLQAVLRRCFAESAERLTPVFTGGDAPLIARYLELDVRLRPDLVLEGLAALGAPG